ncbi:MAG: glycerophosphodiester phosphodiesterase [Clostridiales bacterium]|nr:glycerophosphodiester phosphodiesterase [Clostridiales bacterium]
MQSWDYSSSFLGRILLGLGGFALFVAFRELTVPGLPRLLWYAAAAAWVTVAAPSLFVALGFSSPERSLVPPRGAGRFLTAMALLLAVAVGSSAYAKSLPRPSLPEDLFADEKGALVIAHRGGAALAPEDTIVAFEKGRELGSHWLEMDVWPTADGHIVVIHDDTVDRTTNGQGQVQEMTLHEIQSLDAGYWFTQDGGITYPFRGLGVFVPTLDEVLAALPDTRMVIEIKPDSADFARQVVAKVQEMGAAGKVMLPSFHQASEDAVRKASPKIPTSMTFEEGITFQILLRLGLASFWTPPGNVVAQMPPKMHGVPIITEAFIRMAHYKGLPVHVWTINDATEMRVLNYLGVDAIITDYPNVAIHLRNEGWRRP